MSKAPTISVLTWNEHNTLFRIEGGDIAPEWNPRGVPWCQFTVYHGDDRIASYGGEVWPMAWPALFEAVQGNAHVGNGVRLTAAGRAAVEAA